MRTFYITVLLILLAQLFVSVPVVHSQENYDTAYRNYAQSFVPYEEARREYVLARTQYLQFKTLKSRNDARDATAKMLAARDDVVINYLTALRERIRENPGIDELRGGFLILKLDQEISWFAEHKSKLSSAETPEDLVKDSDQAKKRYEGMEALLYEALIINSHGKVVDYINRGGEVNSRVKDKIEEIKLQENTEMQLSSEKLYKIEGWMAEAEGRLFRAREKSDEVNEEILKLSGRSAKNPKSVYNSAAIILDESNQYLRRSLSILREVIKEVKTAEN
jgi:hypothetical protein